MKKEKWTDEEKWLLWIYNRQGFSRREIAAKLNRKRSAVSGMMYTLNTIYYPPSIELPNSLKSIVQELQEA